MWKAFELDSKYADIVSKEIDRIAKNDEPLNREVLANTIGILDHLMIKYIDDIVDRDGMPYYCHVINGWGNILHGKNRITDYIEGFVFKAKNGQPRILQYSSEGDFHPWQTFAYLAMNGVSPDAKIGKFTISDVLKNSNFFNIPTSESHDFGHMMFAYAQFMDTTDLRFHFKDQELGLREVIEKAIQAHHTGPFTVCRKIHLTEGLIALTQKFDEFKDLRSTNEHFLHGQLEILKVLGTVLSCVNEEKEKETVTYLQDLLKIGPFIENLAFYVGHIVELSVFAVHYGMEIPKEYQVYANFCINRINELIHIYQDQFEFEECFLHLGHYRRSITLFQTLDFNDQKILAEELEKFTLDMNNPTPVKDLGIDQEKSFIKTAMYEVKYDPFFEEVIALSDNKFGEDLRSRGRFPHFRRIIPKGWPRYLHYEYMLEGSEISVELHLESSYSEVLKEHLKQYETELRERFADGNLVSDADWFSGRGYRFGLKFDRQQASKENIVQRMEELIDATSAKLSLMINGRSN